MLDQWIHLALVYDGTTLSLYRNANQGSLGAKTALAIRSGLDWAGYGSGLQIGAMLNSPPDHNWNGMIDDFALFTGALTESQIQTVMQGDFSAFIHPHPQLSIAQSGGRLVLTWSWGVLQGATELAGPWQDDTVALSPLAISAIESRHFYRVRQ